jgi:hypothetical protein
MMINSNVSAGDKVTVEMHQQPGQRSCSNEAIGGDHYGPVQVYFLCFLAIGIV